MFKKYLFISFLVALLGGYLASILKIPLPWTLGALFISILWNLFTPNYTILKSGRRIGQFIIGISLGLYFTPDIVALIIKEWLLLSLGVTCCLLVSLLLILFNSFKSLTFATVYFTYLPGGASEMVNLSKQFGADPAVIAIGHTVRIIMLVFSVPLLATIWVDIERIYDIPKLDDHFSLVGILVISICSAIGIALWRKSKQANPWMIGALFGAAIPTYSMELSMTMPAPLLAFAQILLAMALAAPITVKTLKIGSKYLKEMILSTAIGIGMLTFFSYILSFIFSFEFLTTGLGMMPGGISEMSLTAKQLNLNVAIVTTMQTLRLVIVMVVAKPMYVWLEQLHRRLL